MSLCGMIYEFCGFHGEFLVKLFEIVNFVKLFDFYKTFKPYIQKKINFIS